jgi:predicted PurR-regulated permease PerM
VDCQGPVKCRALARDNQTASRVSRTGVAAVDSPAPTIPGARLLQSTNQNPTEPASQAAARKDFLRTAALVATVGIFILLFGYFLQLARGVVLPVVCAVVVGIMFSPLARRAEAHRVPAPVFALLVDILFLTIIQFLLAAIVTPIVAVAAHAAEVGDNLRQKFATLHPLIEYLRGLQDNLLPGSSATFDGAVASMPKISLTDAMQPIAAFLTPAIGEIAIFLATLLLFLISRDRLRRNMILLFSGQEARLRAIRMLNEIESNLVRYVGTVAAINVVLGLLTALGTFLLGFPSAALLGALAFVCAFIPYIGAAFMTVVLFCVGVLSFPGWHQALIGTALYVAMVALEGYFVTPNIVGMRFTMNPLSVFLSLVFWTWLWGPVGGFLSVPLLIVGVAAVSHLFPDDEGELPT